MSIRRIFRSETLIMEVVATFPSGVCAAHTLLFFCESSNVTSLAIPAFLSLVDVWSGVRFFPGSPCHYPGAWAMIHQTLCLGGQVWIKCLGQNCSSDRVLSLAEASLQLAGNNLEATHLYLGSTHPRCRELNQGSQKTPRLKAVKSIEIHRNP